MSRDEVTLLNARPGLLRGLVCGDGCYRDCLGSGLSAAIVARVGRQQRQHQQELLPRPGRA